MLMIVLILASLLIGFIVYRKYFQVKIYERSKVGYLLLAERTGLTYCGKKDIIGHTNFLKGYLDESFYDIRKAPHLYSEDKLITKECYVITAKNAKFKDSFEIKKQYFGSSIAKNLNKNITKIGNATLDEQFQFKSSNPEYLQEVMNQKTQKEFLRYTSHFNGVLSNRGTYFTYQTFGSLDNESIIMELEVMVVLMGQMLRDRIELIKKENKK